MEIKELLEKEVLSKQDLVALLSLTNEKAVRALLNKADEVRKKYFGNKVFLRGIIEFSNYCKQDCIYCGIRASNKTVNRYRIPINEIIDISDTIAKAGIGTVVLQSGEDFAYSTEDVEEIIRGIKKRNDIAITLSLGERDFETYQRWRDAGADRYLLKHEIAHEKLYNELHPYQNLDTRIKHLRKLKEIGFQTGSGNIIGISGQTVEDIADDLLLCKDINVDMASFSPFIHAENTPLAGTPNADIDFTLQVMAVARLFLPDVHIPATTALSTLQPEGRKRGLLAGANVVMPTFTPNHYRFNYLIYQNKPGGSEDPAKKLDSLYALFKSLGLEASRSKGHSLKLKGH